MGIGMVTYLCTMAMSFVAAVKLAARCWHSSRQTRATVTDMLDLPKIRTEAAKRSFPYL